MEIHLYVFHKNRRCSVIDISIKNSIHLSPRGEFMIVRQRVIPRREKDAPASMGKSPSMFAFTRCRNLVYSVSRDTSCSRWLVLSDVTIFLAQTDVRAAPSCHITRPWRFCVIKYTCELRDRCFSHRFDMQHWKPNENKNKIVTVYLSFVISYVIAFW